MSTGVKALRVLKFGSSVLARPEDYGRAAEEVRAEVAGGCKVVAVVSAMGRTTDQLLAAVRRVTEAPADALVAAVLGTGEEASVALLAMALDAREVSVNAFTRTTIPIRTRGPLQDADPVDVDAERILSVLESVDVVVFPGFVGVDAAGSPSLLGRGGTDLTALFLGHALGAAETRLVKDVDGIFPGDPGEKPDAAPFAYLSWEGARRIGGGVVQEKALAFAARHGLGFRVAAQGGRGTWVGALAEVPPGSATRAG
ncbi:MAG: hypothetical protein OXQ94_05880 [Gemmatimonadota bacterium]|nr:hypothetical protein [Gemmatimonadota bacterium]MDE2871201.1 hypothetical protein [Gemmatimonadota bacterium]